MDNIEKLQLGDIIKIRSTNDDLDNNTFFINYFDPNDFIEIVNVQSIHKIILRCKNGYLLDDSINNIILLNRSKALSFAEQNNLFVNKWVELEFLSDVRTTITAKIVSVQEDLVEFMSWPDSQLFFIDFAYKGIPKNIPLQQICFTEEPISYKDSLIIDNEETSNNSDTEDAKTSFTDNGEMIVEFPNEINIQEDYSNSLHKEYLKNKIPDTTEEYVYDVSDMPNVQETFSLEMQKDSLLDDLLALLPETQRNKKNMKNVYNHINRYTQLREEYSIFDNFGQVLTFITKNQKYYKPLKENLYELKSNVSWIIPVANGTKTIYYDDNKDENPFSDDNFTSLMTDNDMKLKILETSQKEEKSTYEEMSDIIYNDNKPFQKQSSRDYYRTPIAQNINVISDQTMLISINDTLETNVINENIAKNGKVFQQFNGPIVYKKYIDKLRSEYRTIINGDKIDINSILYLPIKYVDNYSNNSPHSNIYEKSKYVPPYNTFIFNDYKTVKKTIELNEESNGILPNYDKIIHVIPPNNNGLEIENVKLKHPFYDSYLQACIPNIFSLIDAYKNVNRESYNILSYIHKFSPYNFFRKDISFGSYKKIRYDINSNIYQYKNDYDKKKEEYNNIVLSKYTIGLTSIPLFFNILDTYFNNKSATKRYIKESYPFLGNLNMSKSEQLKMMYDTDNARLFNKYLTRLNLELITPKAFIDIFVENKTFYDLNKKTVSKKYNNLKELQDDNNVRDLKYDKSYDKNNYDLINKYKKEKKKYSEEQFLSFIADKLATHYGCSLDNVNELANELVQGYKIVREGDYAVLELKPTLPAGVNECDLDEKEIESIKIEENIRKIQQYFKRIQHVWVYDKNVSSDDFGKNETCDFKFDNNIEQKKIVENSYGDSLDKIGETLKNETEKLIKEIRLSNEFNQSKKMVFDKQYYSLGLQAYVSEKIKSPNEDILTDITNKNNDFFTKQKNIYWFVGAYCRDPLPNENENYKYCNDSTHSVPLISKTLYELSKAYAQNNIAGYGELFKTFIDKKIIIRKEGRFIDKHTGFIFDEIDFSDIGNEMQEEVEEQDTWENDKEDSSDSYVYDEFIGKRKYVNSKMRNAYNYMYAICKNMFIPVKLVEDVTMVVCYDIITQPKIFMTEKKHAEANKIKKEKNPSAKLETYEEYTLSKLLKMLVCSLIISIQSLIPNIKKPKKTFGDCVIDFDGYPLSTNEADQGTIKYFACVLRKMKGDTLPWSKIPKKENLLENSIKDHFEKFLENERVKNILEAKRNYLKTNTENIEDHEDFIFNKWERFLPPIQKIEVVTSKNPLDVPSTSKRDELLKTLKIGSHDQWNILSLYRGKLYGFSYGFLQLMNEIVKGKGVVLTHGGKKHIIENSCCNEIDDLVNPISFFIRENKNVLSGYINNIKEISKLFDSLNKTIKAPLLLIEHETKDISISKNNIFCYYSEHLMYKTVIKYCNLDNYSKPIPKYLTSFMEKKNEEYDPTQSLEEKIEFLKSNNKKISASTFNNFIKLVFAFNVVQIKQPMQISLSSQILQTLSDWMSDKNHNEKFNELFTNVLDSSKNKKYNEDEDENIEENDQKKNLDNLENFLDKEVKSMTKNLSEFFKNSSQSNEKIQKILKLITIYNGVNIEQLSTFIKNFLYYFCIIVPSYVINSYKVELPNKPSRSNILMKDDYKNVKKTVDDKYNYLKGFVHDKTISSFLNEVKEELLLISKFFKNVLTFFPHERENLYIHFSKYILLYVFNYLIEQANNSHVIRTIYNSVDKKERDEEENKEDEYDFLEDNNSDIEIMEEAEIEVLDSTDIKNKLKDFLFTLFDDKVVFERDKVELLVQYDDIKKNTIRLEELEKIRMMKHFSTIKDHKERATEKTLKKFHLGRFYTDQKIIKKYGYKRDKMLNTEDVNEKELLYDNNYDDVDDIIFDDDDDDDYDEFINEEEILNNLEGNIDWGDNDEEDNDFLQRYEDDDMYDITERAFNE